MEYYTKSILAKESNRITLLWLENDYCSVEGVTKEQAKSIVESIKSPKVDRKFLKDGVHQTKFHITMSISHPAMAGSIVEFLNTIGIVTDYNVEAETTHPNWRTSFSFFLCKSVCADGHYSAATRITNELIKRFGMISPDYRISFSEVTVC